MALLPIAWNIDNRLVIGGNHTKMKAIVDYPATRDIGNAFGTNFTLKLHLGRGNKRNWKTAPQKTICIELERFCNLSALSVQGSLSIYEIFTNKRVGLKAFQHSFKDGEKSFVFLMKIFRSGQPVFRMFHDLSLHGHICVNSSSSTQTDGDHCIVESDALCPVPEIHKSYSLLSDDFQNMLNNNCFSDVTLNCVGEKFPVHKNILSSRSPVFKAMFESNMKESCSDEIPITDVEPAALRSLLKYMYTGKNDDISDVVACDLLYAADKYDLPVLKEKCVSYLKTAISLDNVYLLLNSAILHDEDLKSMVYDYIFKHSSTILKTEKWKALEEAQPHIYKDILLSLSQHMSKTKK